MASCPAFSSFYRSVCRTARVDQIPAIQCPLREGASPRLVPFLGRGAIAELLTTLEASASAYTDGISVRAKSLPPSRVRVPGHLEISLNFRRFVQLPKQIRRHRKLLRNRAPSRRRALLVRQTRARSFLSYAKYYLAWFRGASGFWVAHVSRVRYPSHFCPCACRLTCERNRTCRSYAFHDARD